MRRFALVATLLLVTAGCVAPFAGQETDAPTATEIPPETPPATTAATPAGSTPANGSVTIAGGTLPADATRVYERTTALLGVTDAPATEVRIADPANMTVEPRIPPFLARLGVDGDRTVTAEAVTGGGAVRLSREAVNRPDLRYVLAHEFVHVAQRGPQNLSRRFYTTVGDDHPGGIDLILLQRSVTEGAATYAGNAYWTRHVGTSPTPAAELTRRYATTDRPTMLYVAAPYYYGYRYLDRRNASPGNLTAVYDDPPRTTEELIHGLAPGSEPPANLTVSTAVQGWEARQEGRVGELGTRLGLRSALNASAAARAADGWGEDRLVRVDRTGEVAYAWTLRWDDRGNATEFETAFRQYLDRRANRADGVWRTGETSFRFERTAPRTTVVFVGAEEFVRNASAAGDEAVTVRAG